jgi:hypothetical protein
MQRPIKILLLREACNPNSFNRVHDPTRTNRQSGPAQSSREMDNIFCQFWVFRKI